jgi:hypothetical protein
MVDLVPPTPPPKKKAEVLSMDSKDRRPRPINHIRIHLADVIKRGYESLSQTSDREVLIWVKIISDLAEKAKKDASM